MSVAVHYDHDHECECAVEVLMRWQETNGAPYQVPCQVCTWEDGDGQFSRLDAPGRPICPSCHGTGWQTCTTLEESPWVIDDLTARLASIHRLWG